MSSILNLLTGGKKSKDLVKIKQDISFLATEENLDEKTIEKRKQAIQKNLLIIKDKMKHPPDNIVYHFVDPKEDVLLYILNNFNVINFESKKLSMTIFMSLFANTNTKVNMVVKYIASRPDIIRKILDGFKNTKTTILMGKMMIQCCKFEKIVKTVFDMKDEFFTLFQFMRNKNFEISMQGSNALKELILNFPNISVPFMKRYFDEFFKVYMDCLNEDSNFLTKRNAVSLLTEFLLQKVFFPVMQRFVSKREYLVVLMKLLNDKSEIIKQEAFHIFKLFAQNPRKSDEVYMFFKENKKSLLLFFREFLKDGTDNPVSFREEKEEVIRLIKNAESTHEKFLAQKEEVKRKEEEEKKKKEKEKENKTEKKEEKKENDEEEVKKVEKKTEDTKKETKEDEKKE